MTRSLLEMAEEVERGSGSDRELDGAVMALFYEQDDRFIGAHDADTYEPLLNSVWVDPKTDKWVSTHPFEFTSSIDVVVALIEAKLPGWRWAVRSFGEQYKGNLWMVAGEVEYASASSGPRALLAATLRALHASPASSASTSEMGGGA